VTRRDKVLLALQAAYRDAGSPVSTGDVLAALTNAESGGTRPSIESVGRYLRALKQQGLADMKAPTRRPSWTPTETPAVAAQEASPVSDQYGVNGTLCDDGVVRYTANGCVLAVEPRTVNGVRFLHISTGPWDKFRITPLTSSELLLSADSGQR
jgi:hypothetical protein